MELRCKKLKINVRIRWNSIYFMLKACKRYKITIAQFSIHN